MRVYRVEDVDGWGPYHTDVIMILGGGYFLSTDRHPSIRKELDRRFGHLHPLIGWSHPKWRCGFNSLFQLRKWFTIKERRGLIYGYNDWFPDKSLFVTEYIVPVRDVYSAGCKQLLFNRYRATLMNVYDFETLKCYHVDAA